MCKMYYKIYFNDMSLIRTPYVCRFFLNFFEFNDMVTDIQRSLTDCRKKFKKNVKVHLSGTLTQLFLFFHQIVFHFWVYSPIDRKFNVVILCVIYVLKNHRPQTLRIISISEWHHFTNIE